jgi:hypothetical protein
MPAALENRINSTFEFPEASEFPVARASELLVVPKSMPIAARGFVLNFTTYYSADSPPRACAQMQCA